MVNGGATMADARWRQCRGGHIAARINRGDHSMRLLNEAELVHVTGAGGSSYYCGCYCPPSKSKSKGNNGYGNGGHDGSPNGKQDRTR